MKQNVVTFLYNDSKLFSTQGAPGSTITLTFLDMDIEYHDSCGYDDVEVRVSDVNAPGERFCGTTLPPVQTSTGNQLLVAFRSDYSVTGRGFRASYVINDDVDGGSTTTPAATTTPVAPTTVTQFVGTCGGDFGGSRGTMASPNYPENYGNRLDCVYSIEVEAGRRVELAIVDFALQNHVRCNRDALEVNLGDGIKVPMK